VVAWRAARKLGISEEIKDLANDAAVQSMTRIIDNISSYRTEGPFLGWCWRITINEVRRKRLHKEPIDIDNLAIPVMDDLPLLEPLHHCLERLESTQQQIILLFYIEEFSFDEVAKTLGITRNYATVLGHRARKALKECLHGRGYTEFDDFRL
ncbi:MAG: sigma-70 family RNA polymerase sigma factor, partial [Caldilineaceae bacterium]